MKDFIETITGKRLMEKWEMDEHEIFQLCKKGLPSYEPWEDSELDRLGYEGQLKKSLQDHSIALFGKPSDCDYMDSAGNAYKLKPPFEPKDILILIFRVSDIEKFENKSKETESGKILPCDPGTQWKDIEINLTSYETVTVKTPKGAKPFHYSELGLSDKRSGNKPTDLWTLLSVFCKYSGRITSETTIHGFNDMSKSIYNLNKKLQKVFGIDEKFCHTYNKINGWVAKCVFNDKTFS